jgi:hypothetical protein
MITGYDSIVSPKVQRIQIEIEPFKYDVTPFDDGCKRIKKEMVKVENGARYEGEWNA